MQKVILPSYTEAEERLNYISHGTGAALGVAALVLCLVKAARSGSGYAVAAALVYGASLIFLYMGSTFYHWAKPGKLKKVLRVIDHSLVFLLISGSLTPYCLVSLRAGYPVQAWAGLAAAWLGSVLGIVLTAVDQEKFKAVQMILYLAIGWMVMVFIKPLRAVFSGEKYPGLVLLFVGGILYTFGAVLFGIGKKIKFFHGVFHIFVLGGSVLMFLSVYLYVF